MAHEEILVKRTQGDYMNITQSFSQNHLQTEVKKSKGKSALLKIMDYLGKHWFLRLYYYVVNRFERNHRYAPYPDGENGVHTLEETCSIAIAADWATDTAESAAYCRCIGHGAMPVEIEATEFEPDESKHGFKRLVMVDKRPRAQWQQQPRSSWVCAAFAPLLCGIKSIDQKKL